MSWHKALVETSTLHKSNFEFHHKNLITFVHLFLQVIKNLLFVAKVIYLISPECDVASEEGTQEGAKNEDEEEEEEERENGHGEEEDEEAAQEKEEEEDESENEDRPPSLLWLMKKLLLMAKREAANTPKVPLKVHMQKFAHVSGRVLSFCVKSTLSILVLFSKCSTFKQHFWVKMFIDI